MREKARFGELTFALSANVTEAHRQVPVHPDDWHLLGCQVSPGGDVFIQYSGHVRYRIGFLLLVPGRSCRRSFGSVSLCGNVDILAHARR